MSGFWVIAAALCAAVLLVLLRPLLGPTRRFSDDHAASNLRILRVQMTELDAERDAGRIDAEQHALARAELERRVLEEGSPGTAPSQGVTGATSASSLTSTHSLGAALGVALAMPVATLALYGHLGNPQAMDSAWQAAASPGALANDHTSTADIESAVTRLAARLQAEPAHADGWALLGRTYARMERFEQARQAYAKALELDRAPDAALLADYVDVLAMTQGGRITPEAESLLTKALALDPKHLKSLALAGTDAMARGDPAKAVQYWTRAREQAPPDSELARGISSGIATARAASGLPPEDSVPVKIGSNRVRP